jgi:hypothetical protein
VSGQLFELRLRSRPPRPYPQASRKAERDWVRGLSDRELARISREMTAIDKAVKNFEKQKKDAA